MGKIGRRLSHVPSFSYRSPSSTVSVSIELTQVEITPHGKTNPESCESSTYKHFEIVSEVDSCTTSLGQASGDARIIARSVKRRQSTAPKIKNIQRIRRARRENRAILMTFLVSVSYMICYMEIINFYILAPFVETPASLFDKILGVSSQSGKVKTYLNLWYYYSLFTAAGTNVLLHFLFNHVVRKGFKSITISTREQKTLNHNSTITRVKQ